MKRDKEVKRGINKKWKVALLRQKYSILALIFESTIFYEFDCLQISNDFESNCYILFIALIPKRRSGNFSQLQEVSPPRTLQRRHGHNETVIINKTQCPLRLLCARRGYINRKFRQKEHIEDIPIQAGTASINAQILVKILALTPGSRISIPLRSILSGARPVLLSRG